MAVLALPLPAVPGLRQGAAKVRSSVGRPPEARMVRLPLVGGASVRVCQLPADARNGALPRQSGPHMIMCVCVRVAVRSTNLRHICVLAVCGCSSPVCRQTHTGVKRSCTQPTGCAPMVRLLCCACSLLAFSMIFLAHACLFSCCRIATQPTISIISEAM